MTTTPDAQTPLQEAAMQFVLDPDNQDCYYDSFHSNSTAWPPEFLLLCDAVAEHCGHEFMPPSEPTADPHDDCQKPGCGCAEEHWIHLGTEERTKFLADKPSSRRSREWIRQFEVRVSDAGDGPGNVLVSEGPEYFYVDGIDPTTLRLPKDNSSLGTVAEIITKLLAPEVELTS